MKYFLFATALLFAGSAISFHNDVSEKQVNNDVHSSGMNKHANKSHCEMSLDRSCTDKQMNHQNGPDLYQSFSRLAGDSDVGHLGHGINDSEQFGNQLA